MAKKERGSFPFVGDEPLFLVTGSIVLVYQQVVENCAYNACCCKTCLDFCRYDNCAAELSG